MKTVHKGKERGKKKKETGSTKLVYRPKLILGESCTPQFWNFITCAVTDAHIFFIR
jgi:hypothetical protein